MKLKDHIAALQQIIRMNPEAREYLVVCSSDDEGNDFQEVVYTPTIGHFEEDRFGHGDFNGETSEEEPANAVCIN